jgi:hypothetical protein
MNQYVLLARHSEPTPDDLARIEGTPGVTILDHTANRAMLLEASEEAVADLRDNLKDWIVAKEVTYPPPGPATESVAKPES